jgi:hypothetical protein
MKILICILLTGGYNFKGIPKEKMELKEAPQNLYIFQNEDDYYQIKDRFEFRPFSLHPSRQFLRLTYKENISNDFSYGILFERKYGDILWERNGFKIPNITFNSYCEINFWKEISPSLKEVREKVIQASKSNLSDFEITKIKEEFHKKYLEKRIEVMDKLGNEEKKIEAEEAYRKYMNYIRGEK